MGGSEDSPPAVCQTEVRKSFSFFTKYAKLIPGNEFYSVYSMKLAVHGIDSVMNYKFFSVAAK